MDLNTDWPDFLKPTHALNSRTLAWRSQEGKANASVLKGEIKCSQTDLLIHVLWLFPSAPSPSLARMALPATPAGTPRTPIVLAGRAGCP